MIVRDGICYADSPLPQVKVVAAKNCGEHLVQVSFNDGQSRLFDGRVLKGEVFAPLSDPMKFAAWKLDYETLTWNDGDVDIAPEYILAHSTECR
jgi:hypothetical protein